MNRFFLTPEADQDLDDIWEFIALDDIDAADRWDGKLRDAFRTLATNPRAGHSRNDLTAHPILFWPVGAYLILYRVVGQQVEVLAVTQGSRDIPSYLLRRT
jgi:plasmid stabilization system protein ParE